MVPAGLRVRLRRPGRDLRARHGARGDLRPSGLRGTAASASWSAFLASSGFSRSGFSRSGFFRPGFCWPEYASRGCAGRGFVGRGLAGSGGDPGRWRRGVLDGVDRGVGGVLRRVLDLLRRILDGFVGNGCCVVGWSGGYERSRHRGAGGRHDRAGRFRSQRPRTERSPAERRAGQRSRSQCRSGEHSPGQRCPSQPSPGQRSVGQHSPCQRSPCQRRAGQCSGRGGYRYRRLDLHGLRPGRCGTGPGRDFGGQRSDPIRHPDRPGRRQRKSAGRSAGTGQPADAAKHSACGRRRR